jgi:hypothetical protein
MVEWKHLTDQQQRTYVERAGQLISKGFVDGDVFRIAQRMYTGEQEQLIKEKASEQNND